MATDFAVCLRRFLTAHLAGLRGCSPNTIASYRDAFKLLIAFFRDERSIPPEQAHPRPHRRRRHHRVPGLAARPAGTTAPRPATSAWPRSARSSRGCSPRTRPGWPAARTSSPSPPRNTTSPDVHHLTVEQTRRLLAQPDRSTRRGRRDATLLATLYDTAARVQELADLTVRDIRLQHPAMAALTGKGRKTRHVPLDGNTAALLTAYLAEHSLDRPGHDDHPVFFNQHGTKLSRGGIAWIIRKYQAQDRRPGSSPAPTLSPHVLRHSKAMHLYEAGVPLPYIRDILGHVDLSTTEIYARASTEAKRKALEAAYPDIVTDRPARMEPGPRTAQLAHQPLTNHHRLCAALDHRTASHQAEQASAAHNPALLIW